MTYVASTLLWSTWDVIAFYNARAQMSGGQTENFTLERAGRHLSDAEDDVGVLAALVGVHALPVVPEQISTG